MFKLKKSEIFDLLHYSRSMVDYADFVVESLVLNIHNPSTIVEIGAGAGGWAISTAKMLNFLPNMHLVENFKWANDTLSKPQATAWPTHADELLAIVLPTIPTATVATSLDKATVSYSAVRYDANTGYDDFADVVRSLETPGIVIIDDFTFSCDINRILYALTYCKSHSLHPLVFGPRSAVWVNDITYRDYLLDELKKHADLLEKYSVRTKFKNLNYFVGEWNVCCATTIHESLNDD